MEREGMKKLGNTVTLEFGITKLKIVILPTREITL